MLIPYKKINLSSELNKDEFHEQFAGFVELKISTKINGIIIFLRIPRKNI